MRARLLRIVENTAAPRNVNARLIQYTIGACGSPPEIGISSAIVAPRAAICASERSTKITPRSTTWTPRYACIPVRMRLATNGAARNSSIEVSTLFASADRRRHDQDFAADVARDFLRCLQIEIRLDQDQLHVLPLHLVEQIEGVLRR